MPLDIVNLLDAGPIPYRTAWERQKELVLQRQRGDIADTLLLLTHPPTITYGKAADPGNRLLPERVYAAQGIEAVASDRGGDVTYHGPGQLVGYPIIHLGEGRRDLHRYVGFLESIVISASSELGVVGAGRASFHAGVWVEDGYLAAVGVRVSRWVTHHGFALNVTDEVHQGFSTIVPCGVTGKPIVTVSRLAGRSVTVAEAAIVVARCFTQQYADYFTVGPTCKAVSAS
jgi:lipoate-protein ligase B